MYKILLTNTNNNIINDISSTYMYEIYTAMICCMFLFLRLIVRGYRQYIDKFDMYNLMVQDTVRTIYGKFGPKWDKLVQGYLTAM